MSIPADDVSHANQIVATVWSMVAVSGLFVTLKILARARRRMWWWWDDYLMLMSWLCIGAASACLTCATTYGLGRHVRFLDADQRSGVLRFGHISAVFTITASVWSKVSFALFLLRISSSGCTEWIRRGIVGIIISLNIMLVTAIIMIIMSCRPVAKTWRPDIKGTCLDDRVKVSGIIALAVYCGIADLILAFLPLKIIWCLPVKRRSKLGLVAVMGLGVFAAMASFIKGAHIHLMISEDFSYDGWRLCFWAIFEPTLTLILASIPVIRTFLRDLVRPIFTRRLSHHTDSESQQNVDARNDSTDNNEPASRKLPSDYGKEGAVLSGLRVDRGDGKRVREGAAT